MRTNNFVTIPRELPSLDVSLRARSRVLLPTTPVTVISTRLLQRREVSRLPRTPPGAAATLSCPACGRTFRRGQILTFSFCARAAHSARRRSFSRTAFTPTAATNRSRPRCSPPPCATTCCGNFCSLRPADVVLDLGCGSGRFCVWNLDSGAHFIGVDTGTFFASEVAREPRSRRRRAAEAALCRRQRDEGLCDRRARASVAGGARRDAWRNSIACWRQAVRCSSTRTCCSCRRLRRCSA